jgi:uncharacterized protein YkwD
MKHRPLFSMIATLVLCPAGSATAREFDSGPLERSLWRALARGHLVVKITRTCSPVACVRRVEYTAIPDDPIVPTEVPLEDLSLDRSGSDLDDSPLPAEIFSPRAPAGPSPAPPSTPPPAPSPAPASQFSHEASCGNHEETRALDLLNAYRRAQGLSALRCDPLALRVARAHSQDMCARGFFSHYNPEGRAPWDRLKVAGGRFSSAGENIAMGYATPEAVHQGWVESPGHQRNMVTPDWTRAAIGLASCAGTLYWTQLFTR